LGGLILPWAEIGGWVRMSGAYHAPHENSIFVKRDMHDQYADKQLQNMQKRIFFLEFLRLCFVFVYQGGMANKKSRELKTSRPIFFGRHDFTLGGDRGMGGKVSGA
jgi:hypothetical protein